MTNREQAKMTMYSGLNTFLTDNAVVYAANLAFTTEKTKFDAVYLQVKKFAAKTGTDNSGFSVDKEQAKAEMAKKAATLSGFAKVRFGDLNQPDLAGQLHVTDTDYTSAADSASVTLAQAAKNLMNDNIAVLAPDYVTPIDLTDLNILITDFQNAQGASDAAHQTEPQDTSAFKDALTPVDDSIDNMKLLGRFYQDTGAEFYNELLLVTALPAVNVHHTNVNVTVTASEDGHTLANATGTLSNSDKTGTSDLSGQMTIEEVLAGDAVLTVNATGRKQVQTQLHINRGKDNDLSVVMEVV